MGDENLCNENKDKKEYNEKSNYKDDDDDVYDDDDDNNGDWDEEDY